MNVLRRFKNMNILRCAEGLFKPRLAKRILVSGLALGVVYASGAQNLAAQQDTQAPVQSQDEPPDGQQRPQHAPQTPEQLQQLVAPIALYPDSLVAPVRPRSVLAIWTTAIAAAFMLLFAAYFFEPGLFWQGMLHARWMNFEPAAFSMSVSYRKDVQTLFGNSPPLMLALPVALVVYFGWKRARYFGNTAPLLIAALALILALGAPNFPGQGFHLTMLVFLFVFVAGVFADLLEIQQSLLVTAGLCGLLSASAIWNLGQLARLK